MSISVASTETYTVVDIRDVFDCFAADLSMVAQATGLATMTLVTRIAHDVKLLAEEGYIWRVDVVLKDSLGRTIRAHTYEVSTSASSWTAERPGDNRWPRTPTGYLTPVVFYTPAWSSLSSDAQQRFQQGLQVSWSPSQIDTTYAGLAGNVNRQYASRAYGLERTSYR